MTTETYLIPTSPDGASSFTSRFYIDESFFDFWFSWNDRDKSWILCISTPNDEEIISGIKLVLNYELLRMHKIEGMPKGSLLLIDMTDELDRCSFDDLGDNCKLFYIVGSNELSV